MCSWPMNILDFWYNPGNIKDGLDNSEFPILYDLMAIYLQFATFYCITKKTIFTVVNHVKTETNLLKPRLLRQMQNNHCQEASRAATIGL